MNFINDSLFRACNPVAQLPANVVQFAGSGKGTAGQGLQRAFEKGPSLRSG